MSSHDCCLKFIEQKNLLDNNKLMSTSTLMKKLSMATAGAAIIALGSGGAAQAATLSFDELPPDNGYGNIISNDYGGLKWDNFYSVNGSTYYSPNLGYTNGRVSGQNVAFNGFEKPSTVSIGSGTFDFNNVYLTAAWNNGLTILVEGFLGGLSKYSKTVIVDTTAPTLFNFDFLGIDSLKFSSSGGTDAGLGVGQTHFAMDNFTYNETKSVPEPLTIAGTVLAGGMGLLMKKKQAASKKAKETAKA